MISFTINGQPARVDVEADKPLLWVLREDLALGQLHAVQKAWIEEQVPQCGYCQPGFIMSAVALLKANPKPSDKDIDEVLSNICRCGTYSAIRRAVHRAAALLGGAS